MIVIAKMKAQSGKEEDLKKAVLIEHLSEIFRLFSQCLKYPAQSDINYLSKSFLSEIDILLRKLPSSPSLNNSLAELRQSISPILSNAELEYLQTEYTGIFIYAGNGTVCYPYESMQLESNKHLVGDSTIG